MYTHTPTHIQLYIYKLFDLSFTSGPLLTISVISDILKSPLSRVIVEIIDTFLSLKDDPELPIYPKTVSHFRLDIYDVSLVSFFVLCWPVRINTS